jgi:formylglycine-generating enzyme
MINRLTTFLHNSAGSKKTMLFSGILAGICLLFGTQRMVEYTSTDAFCNRCHVHPTATMSWKLSTHADNKSGIAVHCVECHLPPHGWPYLREKVKTGMRDVWSSMFRDSSKINWAEKSTTEAAARHTYGESCLYCHANLFSKGLSKEGEEAHLYFTQQKNELACTNCHLNVGHFDPNAKHAKNVEFGKTSSLAHELFEKPAEIKQFADFTEYIPGSAVSFDMIAVPGGSFKMGSPDDESFRNTDEGPQAEVSISPFFMGKIEVSWDEYLAFFSQTSREGRSTDANRAVLTVDAVSGPTTPWGAPDQGWGREKRPAITMTWHAAETYCKWLSQVTGKTYRLPTEAEWEYAARGGSDDPYFFKADPGKLSRKKFKNRLFGVDTATINRYAVYFENSMGKTGLPSRVMANPFGLVNMLGNVGEICSDWYAADTYTSYKNKAVTDPAGPETGAEKVVRGGSYRSDAADIRSAFRDHTNTAAWLKTDPQMPKSVWWYSDCRYVGFRVVCEAKGLAEGEKNKK